jgi:hypothetical protein
MVAFGRCCGLFLLFFYHWSSFKLFGLIILIDRSSPMRISLPLVYLA